jgi:methionyl-tRNA synthetase
MITFDDFKKVELRTARVKTAERVTGSEKLIRLELELSASDQEESGMRQIVAGIGLKYAPEELIGKTIIIVANLEPRKLMGLESNGMLLAASNDEQGPVLLTTMGDIDPGSEVR